MAAAAEGGVNKSKVTMHKQNGVNGSSSPPAKSTPSHETQLSSTLSSTSNRPKLVTKQSNSLPSTPYLGGRSAGELERAHSPDTRSLLSNSPATTIRSQSDVTAASVNGVNGRAIISGCKFETGIKHFKRRMPYALGPDKLESSPTKVLKHLDPNDEKKLTGDMRELYDRLQPTQESEEKRVLFVNKLEGILKDKWPSSDICVHVFGSSGNSLFTNDSDVDICITTKPGVLQQTCLLAKALDECGMEQIECRPHAKVPIVKMWDPELQLACDMNVNNTAALNNTRMMKTYVHMDPRVRPLAMIIKYWTRQRVLNDAALGNTLSSYTWLCMIINFLQCRHPKILPSLQKEPYYTQLSGTPNGFNENPDLLKDFSKQNRETLGDLLFAFFRRYAHEVDYERYIISVREGSLIPKSEKRWHPSQATRLCVEEPFNTDRNLGNTADDTSFRGLHLELRRAFDLVSQGKLEECFEPYIFPTQEEILQQSSNVFFKAPPQPRPVLTRSQSQTGANRSKVPLETKKTGQQGAKSRTGSSNRRASSVMPNHSGKPYPVQYATTASGTELHESLAMEYQKLQRQEQELRARMRDHSTNGHGYAYNSGHGYYVDAYGQVVGEASRRSSNASRTTQQIPLQHFTPLATMPGIASFLPPGFPINQRATQQVATNPPSPSLSHAQPGFRAGARRATTVDPSQYSVAARSHSQPPAANSSPVPNHTYYLTHDPYLPAEWGYATNQRTLQDVQQEYLRANTMRQMMDTEAAYGLDLAHYDSPIARSEIDSASTHDDRASQADSVTDASHSFGKSRSSTSVHPAVGGKDTKAKPADTRIPDREETKSTKPRPRASSAIPSHGISFFADEIMDSPPMAFAFPTRSSQYRTVSVPDIPLDMAGPLVPNGSDAGDGNAVLEPFADHNGASSAYSSDAIMTPSSSAATPTQEFAELSATDGTYDRLVPLGSLPAAIQFGQFPARAPYRSGQQPKSDSKSLGTNRGLYSHTLSGLGINLSNGTNIRDSGMSSGSSKQSSTVAGLNLASAMKPNSFLSPVREDLTPSPTTTRNGFPNRAQVGIPSRTALSNGLKEVPLPNLTPGPKSYSKAHQRARSVESTQRQVIKQDSPSSKSRVSNRSRSPAPGRKSKTPKNSRPTTPVQKKDPDTGIKHAQAKPLPIQMQPSSQAAQSSQQTGAWQQTGSTKKKKNNKKSSSVGSIALPVTSGERKGG